MKYHLEQYSVSHWQQIIKQINELKSMQLSIILKNQYNNNKLIDNGEHEEQQDCHDQHCTPTFNLYFLLILKIIVIIKILQKILLNMYLK